MSIIFLCNIIETSYKSIKISQIKDRCIYTHTSEKFLFNVNSFPNSLSTDSSENKIVLTILWHVDQGLSDNFWGYDPYFNSNDKAKKKENVVIDLHDEYNSATKVVSVERLSEEQMCLYNFTLNDYEYYNHNDFVPPLRIEMDNGSEYVVYKMFNRLFLRKIEE